MTILQMRKSILICTLNNSACILTLPVPPDYDLVGLGEDLRFYIPNKCPGEPMLQVLGLVLLGLVLQIASV